MPTFVTRTNVFTHTHNTKDMRHIKTQAWVLALAMAAGLTLTGCGNKAAQDGKEQTTSTSTKKKSSAKPDKDIYFYSSKDRSEKGEESCGG